MLGPKDRDPDLGQDAPSLPATEEVGVMFLDTKAQETKKISFLNCVVLVPTGLRQSKTLPILLDLFPNLSF